jgi:RNA polymerase sigma factor (sigma-70 family)
MAIPFRSSADPTRQAPLTSEATVNLLELVKQGDQDALDRLLQRCIPALRRWAHGRLPQHARDMRDTGDLVQDAVISAMKKLHAFDARHQGALQAYLRQSVMNRILDVIRYRKRRPEQIELPEDLADERTSPLDQAIGAENIDRYEKALQRLAAADREAIIGRVELQYTYEELAVALNKPSAAAARMAVARAMKRLMSEMARGAQRLRASRNPKSL